MAPPEATQWPSVTPKKTLVNYSILTTVFWLTWLMATIAAVTAPPPDREP